MGNDSKQATDLHLAKCFLAEKAEHAVAAVFDYFGFDCMMRSTVDPNELDALVRTYEQAKTPCPEALAEIIGLIRQTKASTEQPPKELTEAIKAYILQHLTEDITIEEIAARLHISYYYMCHFFKGQTGVSPNVFRTQKRMEKAIHALIETDEKIAEIAVNCGFNNVSYFTECFTKMMGTSPSAFRSDKTFCVHPFYDLADMQLANTVPSIRFMADTPQVLNNEAVHVYSVYEPNETFSFLHEAAVIEFHGVLYASWYCCPEKELIGYTPICGRRSYDGGKTWTDLEIIADDPSGKILYCPPIYGVCDENLYLMMNQMVAPDHIHSLDLYVLDPETDRFRLLWSRPVPFKLNTNVVTLPNGKRMLPGRIAEMDNFPNTPAVLISDNGKIDTEWRLVKIAENGDLPDGKKLVHPELTVLHVNGRLCMFNRNDQRSVPLVYISDDLGEHWSALCAHDVPYINSKIYADTLQDGRNFLVCNTFRRNRSQLTIYFTEKGSAVFSKQLVLFDAEEGNTGGALQSCYPAACEGNGVLYVIATRTYDGNRRGAMLYVIDLKKI